MDRLLPVIGIVAVVALVFTLMAMSWRARRRGQSGLGELTVPPADLGAPTLRDDLLYVATTRADAPLERIAVAGLGFRARAVVSVVVSGIVLELAGRDAAFIPATAIRGVGRATWTIDRAVNTDGLVFVRWQLGDAEVDSYLRSKAPDALVSALEQFTAATPRKDS